jgi:hypothetical protein
MNTEEIIKLKPEIFWGEMAPGHHYVHVYETEEVFLNTLETYILDGIRRNESVINISTEAHLAGISYRLMQNGYDLEELRANKLYFPYNAHAVLSRFMVNGWPDEKLFVETVLGIAGQAGAKTRAFGEMVAILWEQGHQGATVNLENMWQRLCKQEGLKLFCAYPKSGLTQDPYTSMACICDSHSKVISGICDSKSEIYFREMPVS